MNKILRSLQNFMRGRYGNDALNFFLMIGYLVISIINSLFFNNNQIINLLCTMVFIWVIFRSLSKKITARRKENQRFMKLTRPLRLRTATIKHNLTDKQHRYYICPQCNTKVRVPSGHGKIAIICPHCRHEFTKRS